VPALVQACASNLLAAGCRATYGGSLGTWWGLWSNRTGCVLPCSSIVQYCIQVLYRYTAEAGPVGAWDPEVANICSNVHTF
jgi:hypothetical protein